MSNSSDKKKIKVLYVITKSNWGGAQRYVYDLAVNVPKNLYETVVAAGDGGELFDRLSEKNIRYIRMSHLGRDISLHKDIVSFFLLLKMLKKETPDIVHLNSSKVGYLGSLAARFAGTKRVIFTAHGWPHNDVNLSFFVKKFVWFFSFFTILFAHRTVAVSEAIYRSAPGLFFLKNKLVLVKNGVSTNSYIPQSEARHVIIGDKITPKTWVGTIAELHRNKGLKYAIAATNLYNDSASEKVSLVIVGDGEERNNLMKLAAKSTHHDNIFLPGKRPNAARLLYAFDVFFSSSITEALGYVLLEAGVAGLPVVATEVGGTPEIIDHMKNGILVPPRNPKAMSEAIKFLIDNPEKRKEFGEKLKEKVVKEFKLETMIQKTVDLYQVRNT